MSELTRFIQDRRPGVTKYLRENVGHDADLYEAAIEALAGALTIAVATDKHQFVKVCRGGPCRESDSSVVARCERCIVIRVAPRAEMAVWMPDGIQTLQ